MRAASEARCHRVSRVGSNHTEPLITFAYRGPAVQLPQPPHRSRTRPPTLSAGHGRCGTMSSNPSSSSGELYKPDRSQGLREMSGTGVRIRFPPASESSANLTFLRWRLPARRRSASVPNLAKFRAQLLETSSLATPFRAWPTSYRMGSAHGRPRSTLGQNGVSEAGLPRTQ